MTSSSSAASRSTSNRSIPRRRSAWSMTDIVVASTLAVACGIIFWAWNLSYQVLGNIFIAYPPVETLIHGMWLFPAVLGALIIRKPGAAVYCEVVAAAVSALLGSQFGLTVLSSGLLQGLGAEVVFLLFFYRRFSLDIAIIAGIGAGIFGGMTYHYIVPTYAFAPLETAIHITCFAISGAVIAGLLPWFATRALAATSVLKALASRHAHRELAVSWKRVQNPR